MDFILNIVVTAFEKACLSLIHNWPYLLVGILIAALLKLYLDAETISAFLRRFRGAGIVTATTAAVATPLCSCGTTAVVLGMMASTMPWAPIVAFMVASPLTSPGELLYSAGLFGWPFALAFFLSSIFLGLAGGAIAAWIENRGWLKNQTRFTMPDPGMSAAAVVPQPVSSCGCGKPALPFQRSDSVLACGCDQLVPVYADEASAISNNSLLLVTPCACTISPGMALDDPQTFIGVEPRGVSMTKSKVGTAELRNEIYNSGRQLLPMFLGFAFVGYFLNGLIPSGWMAALFGSGRFYSVPLAAALGLPLYINTEGSLPLIRAMLDNGMSQGAALAFMISGAGTSVGAIAGALTIARWRVVALVVSVLLGGAILSGFVYDLLLGMGIFY
jgi:uncharacterized membrane protein YraQ (UPF0718 family)